MTLSLNTATTHILSGHLSDTQKSNQSAKQLFASLKSGDLAGAQKAFAQFTSTQGGKSMMLNLNSNFAQLGAALKAGDLKSAQSLALSLQGGQALASSLSTSINSNSLNSGSGSSSGSKGSKASPLAIMNSIKTQTSMNLFGVLDGLDQGTSSSSSDPLSALTGLGNHINTLA
jgi:hypothetical protein